MSRDTAFSPLAPVMLMIPRRAQGVAGEVSGLLGEVVEGSLQVVEFPSLAPDLLQVATSLVSLVGFEGGDEQGVRPARHVFRRDPTAPPLTDR